MFLRRAKEVLAVCLVPPMKHFWHKLFWRNAKADIETSDFFKAHGIRHLENLKVLEVRNGFVKIAVYNFSSGLTLFFKF